MYSLIPDKELTATAPPPKSAGKRAINIGCSALLVVMLLGIVAFSYATSPARNPANHVSPAVETSAAQKVLVAQQSIASQVRLTAKEWNDGKVHMWQDLRGDSETTFIDVPESASCARMDDKTYNILDGGPPIHYYRLTCNGVIGYVEIDQIR